MEEEKKETKIIDKVTEEAEKLIQDILEEGIQASNIEFLYKIIDIHKDIANEKYWQEKEEEIMRYREYGDSSYGEYGRNSYNDGSYGEYSEGGSYGRRGVKGTGRGRYRDNSYGRRGYDTKYRGEEMLDEMNYSYGEYSNANEYGNYGHGDSTKELEKMLDCNIALIEHLKKNAKSQEEMQIIDQKLQEMSQL